MTRSYRALGTGAGLEKSSTSSYSFWAYLSCGHLFLMLLLLLLFTLSIKLTDFLLLYCIHTSIHNPEFFYFSWLFPPPPSFSPATYVTDSHSFGLLRKESWDEGDIRRSKRKVLKEEGKSRQQFNACILCFMSYCFVRSSRDAYFICRVLLLLLLFFVFL